MIYLDEEALICDFAETYHIYDYRALSPYMAGVLACGLRPNARINLIRASQKVDTDTMLKATIADRLGVLIWQNTEDGQKGRNMPESILRNMIGEEKNNGDITIFNDGAEFEAYRAELIGRKHGRRN